MKENLKRDLNKTYLLLSRDDEEYEEAYELEMIVKNTPQTILPLHVMRMDAEIELRYDVTSKQTLKEFMLHGKIPGSMVRELFSQIVRMEREMKNYLLDPENVLFDPEHIYRSGEQFYFCYCPWRTNNVPEMLQKLLEELLGKLDYSDAAGIELAYHLYQQSCAGHFDIEKILAEHSQAGDRKDEERQEEPLMSGYTDSGDGMKAEEPLMEREWEGQETEKTEPRRGIFWKILSFFLKKETEAPESEEAQYPDAWEEINKLRIPGESEECFGFADPSAVYEASPVGREETVNGAGTPKFFDTGSSTMLLGNVSGGSWRLRPLLPGYEEFTVTGESFLVGKNRGVVDGYIGRETISRIHSRLYVREGRLFVADANSTNGTFVNGEQLLPGADTEIFAGDRVLFADVGYECYNVL